MPFNEKAAAAFLDGQETSFDEQKAGDFLDQKEPEKPEDVKAPPRSGLDEIISGGNRFAAGANDVLLNLLGLPGDAMNFVLEKMGAENRVYGSESIRRLGAKLGIGYEKGKEPDSALYKAGEYTGIGLSFLAPILKYGEGALAGVKGMQTAGTPAKIAAGSGRTGRGAPLQFSPAAMAELANVNKQLVEPAAGIAKGVAQRITAPFITSPKLAGKIPIPKTGIKIPISVDVALASELTASFGAGLGAYYGEKEYGQLGEMVGGILGGLPGTALSVIAPKAWVATKKALFPYQEAGAKPKAAARFQELAETPRAVNIITEAQAKILPEAKIPPAKLSGDRHLIALHNKVLDTDPVLAHKMRLEQQATNSLARKELEKLGGDVPIEETQAYLKGRIEHTKGLINSRVDQALLKAKEGIQKLSPKSQRSIVNKTVNKQINDALTEMRNVENEAWAKVDKKAFSSTERTKSAYQKILLERAETEDPTEIPIFLREFLGDIKKGAFKEGKLGRTETVKNMHGLRSRLTTTIREEKGKDVPNWNKVRVLNQIQESILDDLQGSPAAKDFDEALQVSRTLNEKFRGGIMDTILGHEKTGGRVAPEISLESIKGGPKAAVQIKEVLAASPESFGMTEELVKLNIQQSGIVDKAGRIIPNAAKKYLLKNEDVLDIFPDVRNALEQAVGLEERALGAVSTAKARLGRVDASAAQRVAKVKPGRVLSEVMTAKNPKMRMRTIYRQSSPEGKKGIKNDIVDFLLRESKTGKFDEHDMPILSGQKMSNAWKTNKKVLSVGFNEGEIKRLDMIIETLKKNDDLDDLPQIGQVIAPANRLLTYVARILAAKHGAGMGGGMGGQLQAASMASSAAKRFVEKIDTGMALQIIKDAIQDPELFKTLLTDPTHGPNMVIANKVFQGWMLAHTVSTLQEKP